MHPHFEQHIGILSILDLLLALVAAGVILCVLFFVKKTRPLAWTLVGVGVVAGLVMLFVSYASVRGPRMAPLAESHGEAWSHPTHPSVDIDALLGPRIQLGQERIVTGGESAYASQATEPLEANADETAPPEPDGDAAAPVESVAPAASPSDAASSDFPEASRKPAPASDDRRPEWVENPPPRDPENYPVVIVTDPFASKHEAERQVSQLMIIATSEVLSDLVGKYPSPEAFRRDTQWRYHVALGELHGLGLTPGQLRTAVWRDEYVEQLDLDLPSGEMLRVHTLLEFDQAFQTELQNRWREYQAQQRLGFIGLIAASVVGLLAVVWGALKFDTATKGYYTKWLVSGAVLAIGALAFLVLLA